jgi:hypothetical protein
MWAVVAAAAQTRGAFPNPYKLAPKIEKTWSESLHATAELQWNEIAVVNYGGLDRVTETSRNHLLEAGRVSRSVQKSEVHGKHRTGMKRRIRDNITLLSRDAAKKASRFVASYVFCSSKQMRDQVARSSVVDSEVPGLQGDWELTTRNAMRDGDLLTQWIQPETGRVIKMSYQSWIDDEPVEAETLFQVLPNGSSVPRTTKLEFVDKDLRVRIEYANYAKRAAPN